MKCIDIGCGRKKMAGFIGIDFSPMSDADIVLNLNVERLPFDDSSIDFAFSSHALEHLTLEGFFNIVSEVYRVLKPGAQFKLVVPYFSTTLNFANPFHNNNICFNEHTFRFFSSDADCDALQKSHWSTPSCPHWGLRYSANSELSVEFRTLGIDFVYFPEYRHLSAEERFLARSTKTNVADQIIYSLLAIKPFPSKPETGPTAPPGDPHELVATQLDYLRSQIELVNQRGIAFPDIGQALDYAHSTVRKDDVYIVNGKLCPVNYLALELDYYIQGLQVLIDRS